MRKNEGFTIMELIVVIGIIAVALGLALPLGLSWITDYRFSAATRAFMNAGQVARIKALQGTYAFDAVSISGASGNKTFTVSLDTFTMTKPQSTMLNPKGTGSSVAPTAEEMPIKIADEVWLTGFNAPSYLNGNLFKVTSITAGSASPSGDQWQISGMSFQCESCSYITTSNCLTWDTTTSPQATTTGKVRVAAAVKFIPVQTLTSPAVAAPPYQIILSGNTLECGYNPRNFHIEVEVCEGTNCNNAYTSEITEDEETAARVPVVFDSGGGTLNGVRYNVYLRKRSGQGSKSYVSTQNPVTFTVMPTGRIRVGQ